MRIFAPNMKFKQIILYIVLLLATTACGGGDEFTIDCKIEGLGTRGIEVIYYDGAVSRLSYHPVDGKFRIIGQSEDPVMVDVFTIDQELLFTCVAQNGDHLKVKMNLDEGTKSLSISGQDASADYARWLVANDSLLSSAPAAEINGLIANQVRENPKSMASTLMMLTHFSVPNFEMLADSLLNTLDLSARPVSLVRSFASQVGEQVTTSAHGDLRGFTLYTALDTTIHFSPSRHSYSLLVLSSERKPDSLLKRLKSLAKLPERRLQLVEVSLIGDSAMWRQAIKDDSAKWLQGWTIGAAAHPAVRRLAVPSVPYFVVADSLGHQHYRGTSLYAADTLIRNRLRVAHDTTIV